MCDWEEAFNEASQQNYYINKVTNETTWDMPPEFAAAQAQAQAQAQALPPPPADDGGLVLPPQWTRVLDESSQSYYYFNTDTLESQWVPPEGAVPSATAAVAALSLDPRPASAPAVAAEAARQTTVNFAVADVAVSAGAGVEDEYEELFDEESKRPYFRNKRTNETQWDPPFVSLADRYSLASAGVSLPNPSMMSTGSYLGGGGGGTPMTPGPLAAPQILSEDEEYQEILDPKTGHSYYRHKKTNEITWTRPYRLKSQAFTGGQSVSSLESSLLRSAVKLNPDGTRTRGQTNRSTANLGSIPNTPQSLASESSFSGSINPPTPFMGSYGGPGRSGAKNLLDSDNVGSLPKFPVTGVDSTVFDKDGRRRSSTLPAAQGFQGSADPMSGSAPGRSDRANTAYGDGDVVLRARAGSLPRSILNEIHNFRFTSFAMEHFQQHKKKGMIRSKNVPVEQLMMHSKEQLKTPLLHVPECAIQDAMHTFKQILSYMGDRSSSKDMQTHMLSLLQKGISRPELRDEVYCQLCKQTNKNPNLDSQFRGWELMAQCCCIFPPSRSLENYLFEYLYRSSRMGGGRVSTMAKHCIRALRITLASPPRSDLPSVEELERLKKPTAFSDFSTTLDTIMKRQKALEDENPLPRVFVALTDSILDMKGYQLEGIFRVPGESGELNTLKETLESGVYKVNVTSAHVAAGLLKQWLRLLKTPLIPRVMYDACLKACMNPEESRALVAKLPEINRRIVEHLTQFLALFCSEEYELSTKMSAENLAMVFAPTIFKQEFVSGMHSGADKEQMFVHNLISTAKPMDPNQRFNQ